MEISGDLHTSPALSPIKNPGKHLTGSRMGVKADLGVLEKTGKQFSHRHFLL
jgi:hypothetical protein